MSTDPEPGRLRCPICFAPLVLKGNTGYACSRYPLGFVTSALDPTGRPVERSAAADAGYCEPNGAAEDRFRRGPRSFCFHVSSGVYGWYLYLGAPVLVPVKDSLVDLVADTLADT